MEDVDFTFRPLGREEMARLKFINRACPIEADFSLVFERGGDFLQWPDLIYDRYQYVGAFCSSNLVGYLMVGQFSGWTGQEFGTCTYLGDARVLPSFRGRHLAERMMREIETLLPAESNLGLALVKKGNLPAESLASSATSSYYEGRKIGEFHVLNIPILRSSTALPTVTVRNARSDDLEDMAELFSRSNEKKLFAPRVTAERLRKETSTQPYPGLRDYWLAIEEGRLVGMLAAWDMYPFHYTCLLRYSFAGYLMRAAYNAMALINPGSSPLPTAGGILRTLTLTRIAVQDQDPYLLKAILSGVIRANLGKGYHLLSMGFAEGDPLAHSTRGLPLVQHFESSLYYITRRSWNIETGENPPYVDLVMI
jgi:hypothetical protein